MTTLAFFVLCYAITWTMWLASTRIESVVLRGVLFAIGVFTPGILAVLMTAWLRGRTALETLLRRLFIWDVPGRWYVFAAGYIFTVKLTVAVIHRIALGTWPTFGPVPVVLMFAGTALSVMLGGQVGEELGWRGFALPRLAQPMGLGAASIVLGVIWAGWHLPLFFLEGFDTFNQSFPLYLLQVTAVSVALAWLYGHTRGSLLMTMILHAATNNTKDIVPSADPVAASPWALSHSVVAWMTVALLWLCAAYFLRTMPRAVAVT
jgi:membrane protease YdiL (CAAX protease family)